MNWLKSKLGKKAPKVHLKRPSSAEDLDPGTGRARKSQTLSALKSFVATSLNGNVKATKRDGPSCGFPGMDPEHTPLPATEWLLQLASSSGSLMPSVSASKLAARFAHRTEPVAILNVQSRPDHDQANLGLIAANVALVSSGLRAMLNITSTEDYKDFICSLGEADGAFTRTLQEAAALAQAACGSDGLMGVESIMPRRLNISLPPGKLRLAITPFIIKTAPKKEAAILVEHSLCQQENCLHQLLQQRDLLLGQTDTMLTLCDMNGKVLYQNAAALQFAGNRVSLPFQGCVSAGMVRSTDSNYLKDLLQLEPELLDDLLDEVAAAGGRWSAVVRVPPTLGTAGSTGTSQCLLQSSPFQDIACEALLDSTRVSMLDRTLQGSFPKSMSGGKEQSPAQRVPGTLDLGPPSGLLSTNPIFQVAWPGTPAASITKALSTPDSSSLASKSLLATAPGAINFTMEGQGSGLDGQLKPGGAQRGRTVFRQASRLHTLMEPTGPTGPLSCGNVTARDDGNRRQAPLSPTATSPVLSTTGSCIKLTGRDIAEQVALTERTATVGHRPMSDEGHAQSLQTGCPPSNSDQENEQHEGCWHEITVSPVVDPATGATQLVVAQTDVSNSIEHEGEMAQVSDACVQLLELIFPRHVLEHLTVKQGAKALVGRSLDAPAESPETDLLSQMATRHECVTLFFCDIVGFTTMSKEVDPVVVMKFLNELYTKYDELADAYGVYKVETVGDCYIVAGGLMKQDKDGFAVVNTDGARGPEHALAVYQFAQAVLEVARNTLMPHDNLPMQVRVGLHSGPITAGVVGYRMPKFCLFGDTMNTASRMETTCSYGCIHMSDATYALLDEADATQDLVCTGGVEVKGKGRMITYTYNPAESSVVNTKPPSASAVPNHPPSLASAMMTLYRSATLSAGRPLRSGSVESLGSSSNLSSIKLRVATAKNVPCIPAEAVKDSDAAGVQGHVAASRQTVTSCRASETGMIMKILSEATEGTLPVPSIPANNASVASDDLDQSRYASSGLPFLVSSVASHAAHGSQVGKPGSRLRSSQAVPMCGEPANAFCKMGSASTSAADLFGMVPEEETESSGSHVQALHAYELPSGDNALPGKVRFTDTDNLNLSGSNIMGLARSTVSRQESSDQVVPPQGSLRGFTNPRSSGSFTLASKAARSPIPSQSGALPPLLSLVSTLQRVGTIQRLASLKRSPTASNRYSLGERPQRAMAGSISGAVQSKASGGRAEKPGSLEVARRGRFVSRPGMLSVPAESI